MDAERFDALTSRVATSRRGVLRTLGAGIVAVLAGHELRPRPADAAATCVELGGRCGKTKGRKKKVCCDGFACVGKVCACPAPGVECAGACCVAGATCVANACVFGDKEPGDPCDLTLPGQCDSGICTCSGQGCSSAVCGCPANAVLCAGTCCLPGATCRDSHCRNGRRQAGDDCNANLPGQCASGICGCTGGQSCVCRTNPCLAVGATCLPGGGTFACCSGICQSGVGKCAGT